MPNVRPSPELARHMADSTEIFDNYANNLQAVKRHARVRMKPDLEDIVVCPQCFKIITREELSQSNGQFTLEHVPPESLGGSIETFTCRDCNSWAGYFLDSHLLNWLGLLDFVSQKSGSSVDARVEFGDQAIVNAELQYSENGILDILADPNRTAPDHFENADRLIRSSPLELRFTFSTLTIKSFAQKTRRSGLSLI